MEDVKFQAMLMRVASVTKSTKPRDLAPILGISPAAVSKALTKRTIPKTWLNTLSNKYNLSYVWLMNGDECYESRRSNNDAEVCSNCVWLYKKLENAQEQIIALLKENAALRVELEALKNLRKANNGSKQISSAS